MKDDLLSISINVGGDGSQKGGGWWCRPKNNREYIDSPRLLNDPAVPLDDSHCTLTCPKPTVSANADTSLFM